MNREGQTEHMRLILLSSKSPTKATAKGLFKGLGPRRVGKMGEEEGGTQFRKLESQWMSHNLLDEFEKAENSPGLYHRIFKVHKNWRP